MASPTLKYRLHQALAAVCPIDGVSGGQGAVRIDYRPEATQPQRDAALAALAAFDWSDAAQQAWEDDQRPDRKALRAAAQQALDDNQAFMALASPTNAQVLAQVRRLTQQSTAVIRRLIQID